MKLLKKIWIKQLEFDSNFVDHENLKLADQQTISKQLILELQSEVMEFLRELNYKLHRKTNQQVIESNLIEEWIDIFKYWLAIGNVWGWTPEDFIREFERKSEVVWQRYEQEHTDVNIGRDWVALDIDGVLADYPRSFQNFIQRHTGVYIELQGYDLYHEYGDVIGHEKVAELKNQYRETGEKLRIPLCEGAVDFCNQIHSAGYSIVFLTARPYKQYKRIYSDTLTWLEKNGLKKSGDMIIFDEDKNYRAVRELPEIKFMVEDNGKFAVNIAQLGLPVYLVDKKYNQGIEHKNITRINKLKEIKI